MSKLTRVCEIKGCTNKHYGKGFCNKHYMRIRLQGTPELTRTTTDGKKCKVEGCDRLGKRSNRGTTHLLKGYCAKHYERFISTGSISDSVGKVAPKAYVDDDYAYLPLTNRLNEYAIVDKEFLYLEKYSWYVGQNGYATSRGRLLHHFIMGKPDANTVVDHIDRWKLNNTKENLRIVTYKENAINADHRVKMITNSQYMEVKKMYALGVSRQELLIMFDGELSWRQILRAVRGMPRYERLV